MKIAESVAVIGREGCILTKADTENLTNVKKVIIRNGVTGIEQGTFVECQNIEQVEFSYGITELPECVFMGHGGLRRVKLPGSMKSISVSAFNGCKNLEKVEFGCSTTGIFDWCL